MRLKESELFATYCNPAQVYLFINGIGVDKYNAEDSARILATKSSKDFKLSYNFTEGHIKDFIQAVRQKHQEKSFGALTRFTLSAAKIKTFLLEPASTYTEEEIEEMDRVAKLTINHKVLIVAHSQGNLFANRICKQSSIKPSVIHVANPSSIKTDCEEMMISFDNDPVMMVIGRIGKTLRDKAIQPRTPNHHFAKGKPVSEIVLEKLHRFLVASFGVKDDSDDKKDGKDEQEEIVDLFYNHDFYSYIHIDERSQSVILDAVRKVSAGQSNEFAFQVGPSVWVNDHDVKVTTPWGPGTVTSQKVISCGDILSHDKLKVITLKSSGIPILDDDQLYIKTNKQKGALKRAAFSPVIAGVIETTPSDTGVKVTLRSIGMTELVYNEIAQTFRTSDSAE